MFYTVDISERQMPENSERPAYRYHAAVRVELREATFLATYTEPVIDEAEDSTSHTSTQLLVSDIDFLDDAGVIARHGQLTELILIYRPWMIKWGEGFMLPLLWLDLGTDERGDTVAMYGLPDGTVIKPGYQTRKASKRPFQYGWRRFFTAPEPP